MPLWYGGDYTPEQWPRAIWGEDAALMKRAGVTMATVGVFAWSRIEPREGEFDFEWLDEVLDLLHANGVRIDLATATASPPPWLTHRYPEVLPVTENGVRLAAGSRQHYCPSSPVYRRLAARLVTAIVERYAGHPALELWHINNEYGCHVNRCYCDVSAQAFRAWLARRYDTIQALNESWGTTFWSQEYGSFEEVYPPSAAPTFRNPAQVLDFDRFSSDELLECFRTESAIVRRLSPGVPLTTNFMGFFKPADYWTWAQEVDIVSDDSYPDPVDPASVADAAMTRDLMRSLGSGKPWMLMEQATGAVNWRRNNAPKRTGQMRAWSYQALARGATAILFFQWRQSVVGAEKFHSGMLPHSGTDSRIWRNVESLGAEFAGLPELGELRIEAKVAILLDWDSWWGIEQDALPGDVRYLEGMRSWYRTLHARNVTVDFVRVGADLSAFSLVIVPSLFIASSATLAALDAYAKAGGHLLVTYQSGICDPSARITAGGYLGVLASTLGIRIDEFAPPANAGLDSTVAAPGVRIAGVLFDHAEGTIWAEFLDLRGADVMATFIGGDLDGRPAITRHRVGAGEAWYAATLPDEAGRNALLATLLDAAGVETSDAPPEVEIVVRSNVTFAINHGDLAVELALSGTELLTGRELGSIHLDPQGVAILRR